MQTQAAMINVLNYAIQLQNFILTIQFALRFELLIKMMNS